LELLDPSILARREAKRAALKERRKQDRLNPKPKRTAAEKRGILW
jgi:hypothetical protein